MPVAEGRWNLVSVFWGGCYCLFFSEILHQLRLVVYPIIYDGFYTSQVVIAGFLNHQQYEQVNLCDY